MIDRRSFLKLAAFIPLVVSRLDLNPRYGTGGIVGIASKGIPGDCLVSVQWSQDGVAWYDVLDPPFHPPCLCKIEGVEFELKNDGRVGGIIIDKET